SQPTEVPRIGWFSDACHVRRLVGTLEGFSAVLRCPVGFGVSLPTHEKDLEGMTSVSKGREHHWKARLASDPCVNRQAGLGLRSRCVGLCVARRSPARYAQRGWRFGSPRRHPLLRHVKATPI